MVAAHSDLRLAVAGWARESRVGSRTRRTRPTVRILEALPFLTLIALVAGCGGGSGPSLGVRAPVAMYRASELDGDQGYVHLNNVAISNVGRTTLTDLRIWAERALPWGADNHDTASHPTTLYHLSAASDPKCAPFARGIRCPSLAVGATDTLSWDFAIPVPFLHYPAFGTDTVHVTAAGRDEATSFPVQENPYGAVTRGMAAARQIVAGGSHPTIGDGPPLWGRPVNDPRWPSRDPDVRAPRRRGEHIYL